MKFSLWKTLLAQFARVPPVITDDLTGQTVMVVGANIGLGFEASKHFARMNPGKLILACRSKTKGDEALATLRRDTGFERGEVWVVDLADFASVSGFAARFNEKEERLDILVANAGCAPAAYNVTNDGYETTLQVNHLSTALISLLFLPKMISTSRKSRTSARKPRLVVVSSGLHHAYQFDAKALAKKSLLSYVSGPEHSTPADLASARVYGMTKLLGVFFTRVVASRLRATGTPVIATLVEPVYCRSSLRRDWTGLRSMLDAVIEFCLARSTEAGSRQLIAGALAFEDEKAQGQLIDADKISEVADYVLENEDLEDRIWDETIAILIKAESEVSEIVRRILGDSYRQ